MRAAIIFALSAASIFSIAAMPRSASARPSAPQKKEYLSDEEADKIRNADSPNIRVKLYLSFAADRLKKFQYELDRTMPQSRRGETLNGLLNAYSGCIDDAADVISLAVEKQQDIRAGIKEIQNKGQGIPSHARKNSAKGHGSRVVQGNSRRRDGRHQDAIRTPTKAEKEMAPPPVRRPQS